MEVPLHPRPKEANQDTKQAHLELTLGMSLPAHDHRREAKLTGGKLLTFTGPASGSSGPVLHPPTGGLGNKRWFSDPAGVGFVHPWSLAARQEKAVFEQAHLNAGSRPATSGHSSGSQPAPVVGWPPIRASRKNMANPRPSKSNTEEEEEKEAKKSKISSEKWDDKGKTVEKYGMFVKVNMEGFAVGRKINLMAYDGYESLSCALRSMFDNFLYVKQSHNVENDECVTRSSNLVFLYEDNEGDRMLVGDVPWEMFVGSVKRLYITYHSKHCTSTKEDKEKKGNNEVKTNVA